MAVLALQCPRRIEMGEATPNDGQKGGRRRGKPDLDQALHTKRSNNEHANEIVNSIYAHVSNMHIHTQTYIKLHNHSKECA